MTSMVVGETASVLLIGTKKSDRIRGGGGVISLLSFHSDVDPPHKSISEIMWLRKEAHSLVLLF